MKHVHFVAAFMTVALLSGCGSSRIDAGQLDYDNGTAYRHGSNTPYSGIVDFDTVPDFARDIGDDTNLDGHTYLNIGAIDHCAVSFKTGAIDGNTTCYNRDGGKALFFTLHRGHLDDKAIRYNRDGDTIFDTSWRDGALAGKQHIYSPDGKYLIHAWTVRDGHKRGEEVRHTDNGDDLAEGTWSDEGKFTGSILDTKWNTVFTLKDGVREGVFRRFTDVDDDKVLVEGDYKDGLPSGKWTFYGQNTFYNYGENDFVIRDLGYTSAFYELTNMDAIRILEVHWEAGHLEGRVRGYDQDKNQIVAFDIKDGQITTPVERYDSSSDKKFVITNPAIIAALNYTKPASEANQWGSPLYDQGYMLRHPQEKAALLRQQEAREQAETLRNQEIAYVLDPVHRSLPVPAPEPAPSMGDLPTGSTVAAPPAPTAPMPSEDPARLSGMAQQVPGGSAPAVPASAPSLMAAPDATSETCVMSWVTAYRKEVGQDVIVTQDQLDEWGQWCRQGKHPGPGQR